MGQRHGRRLVRAGTRPRARAHGPMGPPSRGRSPGLAACEGSRRSTYRLSGLARHSQLPRAHAVASARVKGLTRRHVWASLLFVVGFGLTIALGVLAGADDPPSRSTSALLVVLAGVFQVASASQFHSIGRADPGLARAAVRRLIRMGTRAGDTRQAVEASFDKGSAAEQRRTLGLVSVELSWIEEGILEAVEDWNEFHQDALKRLTEGKAV